MTTKKPAPAPKKCVLHWDKDSKLDGQTFYSNDGCLRDTGIYCPKGVEGLSYEPDVILWLHGWYVGSAKNGLEPPAGYETMLRESLLKTGRNVVLVFPWLGKQTYSGEGTLGMHNLAGGKNVQIYLDTVLAALTQWVVDHLIMGEIEQSGRPPDYKVGRLAIGCHSGGGDLMRVATGSLGDYADSLAECWGFDCMYASGTTYEHWARPLASRGVKLYFYLANGSSAYHFAEFWKAAFGTLKEPKPAGLPGLYLAPSVPGFEVDSTAFQSTEQIKAKPDSTNAYDVVRRKIDPLIYDPEKYRQALRKEHLRGHFEVVQSMFGHRISASRLGW